MTMFRKTTSPRRSRATRCVKRPGTITPPAEPLEARLLFSTYTVTTLGDGTGTVSPAGSGKFNASTLRAAVNAANARAGADTINFAVTGKIDLLTALPQVGGPMTITGPGASKLTVE